MTPQEFSDRLDFWRNSVEREIDQLVPSGDTAPTTLHQAMRHSLEAGGKRIRPILTCAMAECFNQNSSPLPAAVAVECLHTYTLIHDDLPAMDNSDLRRGRPTCHIAFGEAAAILAGDALLTFTFEVLSKHYSEDPQLAIDLIKDLSTASGSLHLVGGQMEDIENEGTPLSADALTSINRKKTGALLTAACTMGARIGKASPGQLDRVQKFGALLGEAFQVIDDILDYTSTPAETGKSSGKDAANGKTTLPAIEGLDSAKARADLLTTQAQTILDQMEGKTDFLKALLNWLANRAH